MLPLLIKDQLVLPCCATVGLFYLVTMTTTNSDVKAREASTPTQDSVHPLLQSLVSNNGAVLSDKC